MSKEWDRANMKTLGVNLKREEAQAFQQLAKDNGSTVGAMLRAFVQSTLAEQQKQQRAEGSFVQGLPHIVSYKNADLLKHEVAFHNPKSLNPDGMLNDILDQYFAFVKRVRV